MFKKTLLVAALLFSASAVYAQSQSNGCDPLATSCTGSNLNAGDVAVTNNNGDTHSTSSQLGNSSASNVSGNTVNTKTVQDATNTTTGTISGGNTSSLATGGSANGNQSTNNNQSSVGNTSSSSGGNSLTNGSNTATNTVQGGSVGNTTASGGAGGSSSSTATGGTTTSAASGGRSASTSSANGTNTSRNTNSTGSLTAATTGNQTSIGGTTSQYQDNSKVIIPPPLPGTPPSVVGATQAIATVGACGPLVRKVKTEINGTFHGILFDKKVPQGYDEDVEPVVDNAGVPIYYDQVLMPDGHIHLMGSQIQAFDSVNGTSSARQIGIGTGGSGGGYGQGALGASSSNQQQQVRLIVRPCDAGVVMNAPNPVYVPAPAINLPPKG